MKKRSRDLSPPLFLSDRVQCVVAVCRIVCRVRGRSRDLSMKSYSLEVAEMKKKDPFFSVALSSLHSW